MQRRPVEHDAWHRIAPLRPRLRASVHTVRQRYRGRRWHVIEDAASNQYARLSPAGYAFVGLLDGTRTAGEALRDAERRLGDASPTRAEAVRLLSQLSHAHLLAGDITPDAVAVFERHRRRQAREFRGHAGSFLFVRIPLLDPDGFLELWGPVGRLVYSPIGAIAWLALLAVAVAALVPALPSLRSQTAEVLAPGNLLLLAVVFVATKLLHELGHGFACKAMSEAEHPRDASGGEREVRRTASDEVHQLGVMLLALFPVPYVDTSSVWTFRSPWRRIVVNAAGMHAELAVAAVAAIVFASANTGTVVHALAYNTVFLAGVTTVLFNANPLLRYDGYYILADLTGTPNLNSRSRDVLLAGVRRWLFGVRSAHDTAEGAADRAWLGAFGVASAVYRVALAAVIIWFVSGQLFVIGAVLAMGAAVVLVVVPLARAVRYVAASPELERTRGRAVAASLAVASLVVAGVGLVPVPDTAAAPGVVEPAQRVPLHAASDGVLAFAAAHGGVLEQGDVVLRVANAELLADVARLRARREAERTRGRIALRDGEQAEAQSAAERAGAIGEALAEAERRVEGLTLRAESEAMWLSVGIDERIGTRVERGERLGALVSPRERVVTAVVRQMSAGAFVEELVAPPRVVAVGRPDAVIACRSFEASPAATTMLPAASLSYRFGGPVRAMLTDDAEGGVHAAEPFFTLRVVPAADEQLLIGERVWVRFERQPKPIAEQAARYVRQLLQRRASGGGGGAL